MEDNRLKIAIIGAGNVASHLAVALSRVATICQVVSRNPDHARLVAQKVGEQCRWGTLEELVSDAGLYIVSVADDAIREVVAHAGNFSGLWVHTSGSVPADVFLNLRKRYGVFYPLQTFTKGVDVDFSVIPFLVEGSTPEEQNLLATLASRISERVIKADSSVRGQLHVAAVFACNFANLMWAEADEILQSSGLDITFLMPLLEATLQKLSNLSPQDAMTGPARRGDCNVIASHLRRLDGEKKEIYRHLSDVILERYGHAPASCNRYISPNK